MSRFVFAVKVLLVPEGHVMTVAFAIGLSILELKRHLGSELRVPPEVLQISLDGTGVLFFPNRCWKMFSVFVIGHSASQTSYIKMKLNISCCTNEQLKLRFDIYSCQSHHNLRTNFSSHFAFNI